MTAPLGVLLLTFGSAVTADDVPQYLASVRAGRAVPDDVVSEFQRRYTIIGRSPLIDITREQARDLRRLMESEDGAGSWRVEVGMLHSEPRVAEGVEALAEAGVRDVVAVVLAPQYSPLILAGYERAIATTRDQHPHVRFRIAGAWHTTAEWIDSLAERLAATIADLPGTSRDATPVIFTAHSLPRAVVDRDPGYIDQLKETAQAVAARSALQSDRWFFAYQSAGHTPEEWLTPDVKDLLPELRRDGHDAVIIAPVQFLADHLEILYDIDVAARAEAESLNMTMHRIEMPNTSPTLIRALSAVARRELGAVHQA